MQYNNIYPCHITQKITFLNNTKQKLQTKQNIIEGYVYNNESYVTFRNVSEMNTIIILLNRN